jgi:hypothetical protein
MKNINGYAGQSVRLIGVLAMAVPWVAHAAGSDSASLPSGEQILSKYESFMGGSAAASKVTSRTVSTRRLEHSNTPAETNLIRYSKKPMLSIMHHEALDGSFVRYMNGCDATGGWLGYGRGDAASPPTSGKATTDGNCEEEAYYYGYLPLDVERLKQNVQRYEVKAKVTIVPADPSPAGALAGGHGKDLVAAGPRQTYLVLSTPVHSTDPFVWLYFDVDTGALLRRADAGHGPKPDQPGTNARYTDFIQYRDVGDGTRAPFQFVSTSPNSEVRGIETNIDDKTPLADDLFVRPKDVAHENKGL